MKKRFLITTTLLYSILLVTMSISCSQSSNNTDKYKSDSLKETISEQQVISGETWLKSIFQCQDGNGYCFPDEESVLTEQYYQFFIESLNIYEYPDFETEEEREVAEEAYEDKWKDVYPLDKDVLYPFGRGNGVEKGFNLKNVTISHLSDLKYSLLVDYGVEGIFLNALLLVPSDDAFLIDYIETKYLDSAENEDQILILQNLALANFQLGVNPLDAHRLMGKPLSETTEEGSLEVSGFVDEDYVVITTTMEYKGIKMIYEDNRMIHAYIDQPGKSFGWITCGDKECDKNLLMKKFNLTKENIYNNEEGEETIFMGDFVSLNITLDENDLVKTIEFNTGP